MAGRILNSTVHIMNLPTGTPVHEPADAHRHQVDYTIENDSVRILGFFSTRHQRVFTHHDTFLHLHLITADGRLMGHVDTLLLHGEEMELKIGL
jgi:acetolactate decarboxylase